MIVASSSEVLDLLRQSIKVAEIVAATGWPTRRIHVLASRHGFLIHPDGTPYRPPPARARLPQPRADRDQVP